MIIIDTSIWIMVLNGTPHPKADRARDVITGSEDVGIPGIILDEILRGIRNDTHYEKIQSYLIEDFDYLEMTRSTFLQSAAIYRSLRKKGITLKNPADCLIAASVLEYGATLLENDADFRKIAVEFPLQLL
ncbi:MAG TPA: PIN domain-containing protein [bacterium]|nr:PIN domain-containing protein [bacterium]